MAAATPVCIAAAAPPPAPYDLPLACSNEPCAQDLRQQRGRTTAAASASASAASSSACCRRAAAIFAGSASGTVPVWYFFTKRFRRLRVSFWRSLVSFRRFWYSRRRCCQGVSSSAVSLSSLPCRRGPHHLMNEGSACPSARPFRQASRSDGTTAAHRMMTWAPAQAGMAKVG